MAILGLIDQRKRDATETAVALSDGNGTSHAPGVCSGHEHRAGSH